VSELSIALIVDGALVVILAGLAVALWRGKRIRVSDIVDVKVNLSPVPTFSKGDPTGDDYRWSVERVLGHIRGDRTHRNGVLCRRSVLYRGSRGEVTVSAALAER
jgi:hypothetical protein